MLADLTQRLSLADDLLAHTLAGGWALFGVLAVTAFLLVSIRTAVAVQHGGATQWALTMLVIAGCLSQYREIVAALADAAQALTEFFADAAGWDLYWDRVALQFEPLFNSPNSSTIDRLMGWLKAGTLTVAVSVCYYLQFVVWEWVGELSGALLLLLYVLGPLSLAAAAIRPALIQVWFLALVYVLLWNPILPFLMWATLGLSGHAIDTGNVAAMIRQSAIMTLLSAATPLIALFVMGGSGFASFAAGAASTVSAAVSHGVGLATDAYGRWRGGQGDPLVDPAAMASAAPARAGGLSPGPPQPSARPGDDVAASMDKTVDLGPPAWQSAVAAQASRKPDRGES